MTPKRPGDIYGHDKRDVILQAIRKAGYRVVGFRPPVPGDLAAARDIGELPNRPNWWLLSTTQTYPENQPRLILEQRV